MTGPMGPFDSERDARRTAHSVVQPDDGWSILGAVQNRLLLMRACRGARVELGVYDRRVIDHLASQEDATCAVIAGMVARAYEAGRREGEQADG